MVFAHWSYDAAAVCLGLFLAAFAIARLARPPAIRRRAGQAAVVTGGLVLLVLPAVAAAFVAAHQALLLAMFTSHWCLMPAVIAGPALYWARCRAPLVCGVLEIVGSWIMIAVAIQASSAGAASLPAAVSGEFPLLTKAIAVLGGIYVSVRGLENIERGATGRFRAAWQSVFPRSAASSVPRA